MTSPFKTVETSSSSLISLGRDTSSSSSSYMGRNLWDTRGQSATSTGQSEGGGGQRGEHLTLMNQCAGDKSLDYNMSYGQGNIVNNMSLQSLQPMQPALYEELGLQNYSVDNCSVLLPADSSLNRGFGLLDQENRLALPLESGLTLEDHMEYLPSSSPLPGGEGNEDMEARGVIGVSNEGDHSVGIDYHESVSVEVNSSENNNNNADALVGDPNVSADDGNETLYEMPNMDSDASDSESNEDVDRLERAEVDRWERADQRRGRGRGRGKRRGGCATRGRRGGARGGAAGRGRTRGRGRGRGRPRVMLEFEVEHDDQEDGAEADGGLPVYEDGWGEAGRVPHIGRFKETPGPKGEAKTSLDNEEGPIELFNIFFDDQLVDQLVTETNRYAAQQLGLPPYFGPTLR